MFFTDVAEDGHVEEVLEKKHKVKYAPIPFDDGHGQTAYWISSDGIHVYVGTHFGGWWKLKEVKIYPAGFRSKSSVPCFKRRNLNGKQCYCAIPQAVYGAFVLKDTIPKFKFKFRDGNIGNCRLNNLVISDDSTLVRNMEKFCELYRMRYNQVVDIVNALNPKEHREKIEDYVSTAFISMCSSRKAIKDGFKLWIYKSKETTWQSLLKEKINYVEFYPTEALVIESSEFSVQTQLLSCLPPHLYDTMILSYEGYNQYEIAEILGVSQALVNSRLKKIKRRVTSMQLLIK